MKDLREIFKGLLYAAAGIALATCAGFVYIAATEGAQATQELCVDIVKAFEDGRTGRR